MKRSHSISLHVTAAAVIGTGVLWGYYEYVWDPGPEPDDPELLMEWTGQHELVPVLRTLHLFAVPALVFAVGVIWSSHVAPRILRRWARRATGLTLAALMGPMVVSGVALQTAIEPSSRAFWIDAHVVSSIVWSLAYLAHQLRLRRRKRRAEPGPSDVGAPL
ncbi:MAG: hypothetical protein AAFU73_23360 [Planctomycetota bacterium]